MSASPFHNSRRFAGKRLHLGVCGSIACYKALDLLRALHALDIHVSVTLTDGARRFVTPLLFEALGAMPVYGRMFEGDEVFDHLEPGQRAQAMLVAPASADALSRLAAGAASDMLSAQALAFDGPLVVAPAMNPRMWRHPATQDNVATLRRRGARVVVPGCGGTACGDTGQGRLAPVEDLFLAALRALSPQDMAGQRVMLTMGPTREKWDGVRYWTNPSSGTMGAALATSAWLRAICSASLTTACCSACSSTFRHSALVFSSARRRSGSPSDTEQLSSSRREMAAISSAWFSVAQAAGSRSFFWLVFCSTARRWLLTVGSIFSF